MQERKILTHIKKMVKSSVKKILPKEFFRFRSFRHDQQYHSLVADRIFSPVTDVHKLAEDIPIHALPQAELHLNNLFYGLSNLLQQFAGVPSYYNIKAAYTHIFYGKPWTGDTHAPFPLLLVWGEPMRKAFSEVTDKKVVAIGPPISYAVSIYDDEAVLKEKERLGKNALIFPAHSTHFIQAVYPVDFLLAKARELRQHFDSVRFCLYWKDILSGSACPFLESEYECVTAGHMFDPMFYPRLKGILSVADQTFSNIFGTQAGFSVGLNVPHTIFAQDICHEGDLYYKKIDPFCEKIIQISECFYKDTGVITFQQRRIIDEYYGFSQVKTPSQLRGLFESAENLYSAQQ